MSVRVLIFGHGDRVAERFVGFFFCEIQPGKKLAGFLSVSV